MFLVGLTGGIATGKSSVSSIIRSLGIEIIDADKIAREVVIPGRKAWKKIKREFGDGVLHSDDTLNREALGEIVFNNNEKRMCLNKITHPEIYKTILWRVFYLFFAGHQFAVIDLPLLYESGKMVKYLSKTIVVFCETDLQIARLRERNGLNSEEAKSRIDAQMPLTDKVKLADFIINNNGPIDETRQQVENVISTLKQSKAHWKIRSIVYGTMLFTLGVLSFAVYKIVEFVRLE